MHEPTDGDSSENPEGVVRTARIVALALIAGTVSFLVIANFLRARGPGGWLASDPWSLTLRPGGLISLMALVMAAVLVPAAFVVPPLIASGMRRQIASGRSEALKEAPSLRFPLVGLYMNQLVIGLALLEGAAFFNLIAFMIEGKIPNLIAGVILILLMLVKFPTLGGFREWIEDEEAKIREERAGG